MADQHSDQHSGSQGPKPVRVVPADERTTARVVERLRHDWPECATRIERGREIAANAEEEIAFHYAGRAFTAHVRRYRVDLYLSGRPNGCTCPDALYRRDTVGPCKHEFAAAIRALSRLAAA